MLAVMDVDGDSEIGGDANVDREGAEDGDVIIVEGDAAGGFLDDEDVVVEQRSRKRRWQLRDPHHCHSDSDSSNE